MRPLSHNCGVYWMKRGKYNIQWHHPKWGFIENDYYFMFPTVFRIMFNSPCNTAPHIKESGFGIVILGFGIAVTWEIKPK